MEDKTNKKFKLGLIPKLIIAIALGILVGKMCPEGVVRVFVTFSSLFGAFLNFIIPLMILAYVTKGIADLTEGAGKLLGITVLIAYCSTLIGGSLSYFMSVSIFPSFIKPDLVDRIKDSGEGLKAYFGIPLDPILSVTSALVFAFMLGTCVSYMKTKGRGDTLYNMIGEFNEVITLVLDRIIIPVLPFYIFGNFSNMSYTGSEVAIMSIFWKIFICVIILHLLYVTAMFSVAGIMYGKSPIPWIKNQVSGYLTAVGTQSSAATIPVNVECAKKNGVSQQIRDFVVPLCATVHLPGSMITLTACCYTLLLIYGMPHSYGLMIRFIAVLGIAMVAAPGAPGGAVMSALPFIPMLGLDPAGAQGAILISLYITQDSFGTAANVSGDNAIALYIDKKFRPKDAKVEEK